MKVLRALDRWLFAPGTAGRLRAVHVGLTILIGLRIALGPYRSLAGQPAELFRPVPLLSWLDSMPAKEFIVALQLVGTLAALLALAGYRRRGALAVAWTCLLVLAGLRGSLGKILHNDVLLLLSSVPFLVAPRLDGVAASSRSARYGWPVRTALVVVAGSYFFSGLHKLVLSGAAWITGDNMRYILYTAANGAKAPTDAFARFVADRAWLSHVAAGLVLGLEVTFPVVLWLARARPVYAIWAVVLHVGTWLTLGLDYWAHLGVVVLILTAESPWLISVVARVNRQVPVRQRPGTRMAQSS